MDADDLRCETPLEFRDFWHNVRDKIPHKPKFTEIHNLLGDAFAAGENSAMIMREEPIVDSWGLEGRAPLRTRLRREHLVEVIAYKVVGNGRVGSELSREDYVFCGASSVSMSSLRTEVHLQNRMGGDFLFSLRTGNELDWSTHRKKERIESCERIAPEDLCKLRIRCGRDDLNHSRPTTTNLQITKSGGLTISQLGDGHGVTLEVDADQLPKVAIDHFDMVVIEPNGWLIERRKAHSAPWRPSTFFPFSLSHSAIDFYIHELARLRQRRATVTKPFEGIQLIMMIDAARVPIARVAVGFSEHVKKEGGVR